MAPSAPEGITLTTPEERAAILHAVQDAARKPAPVEPIAQEPVHAKRTRLLFYDAELGEAISQALTIVNVQRKKQKEPPIDWNTFVVYGLVKNGLAAFEAARAEYEASSRLVLSADEVRARAGRNR